MKLYNSLLTGRRTILHFDNKGRYGHDFREAQIRYLKGCFMVSLTDGYKFQGMNGFTTLKAAIEWANKQLNNKAA